MFQLFLIDSHLDMQITKYKAALFYNSWAFFNYI